MADERIRVLVTDDHPMFNDGIRLLLESEPDIRIVAIAPTGADAVRLAVELQPDVVLMDMLLPDMSGVEATRQLLDVAGGSRVLVLSAVQDPAQLAAAFEAGAIGFVPKTETTAFLVDGIRRAAKDEGVVPARYVGPLLKNLRQREDRRTAAAVVEERLTDRQRQVLMTLAEGRSVREAADELHISVFTLRGHVRGILAELGVRSIAQAVAVAFQTGLVRGVDAEPESAQP